MNDFGALWRSSNYGLSNFREWAIFNLVQVVCIHWRLPIGYTKNGLEKFSQAIVFLVLVTRIERATY